MLVKTYTLIWKLEMEVIVSRLSPRQLENDLPTRLEIPQPQYIYRARGYKGNGTNVWIVAAAKHVWQIYEQPPVQLQNLL